MRTFLNREKTVDNSTSSSQFQPPQNNNASTYTVKLSDGMKSDEQTPSVVNKKWMLQNGMRQYMNEWTNEYGGGVTANGVTVIDLVETKLKMIKYNLISDYDFVKSFIESFWTHSAPNAYYGVNISAIHEYAEEYDPLEVAEFDEIIISAYKQKKISYRFLLNTEINNDNYLDEYDSILDYVSKLLTGQRDKELLKYFFDGYFRENVHDYRNMNVPREINELCHRYLGGFQEPLNLKWDSDLKKTSMDIKDLLYKVIEGDGKNIGWKCVLFKGKIDQYEIGCYDSWYLWWFYGKDDSLNETDVMIMQFTYDWEDMSHHLRKNVLEMWMLDRDQENVENIDGYDDGVLLMGTVDENSAEDNQQHGQSIS